MVPRRSTSPSTPPIFIAAINHDKSVSSIIDPIIKIRALLEKHGIQLGG